MLKNVCCATDNNTHGRIGNVVSALESCEVYAISHRNNQWYLPHAALPGANDM